MSKDGSYLGILKNSLMDDNTGIVSGIVVEPSKDIDTDLHRLDENGNLVFSFNSIKLANDDNIIVG